MRKLHSSPAVLLTFLLLAVMVPAFAARARFFHRALHSSGGAGADLYGDQLRPGRREDPGDGDQRGLGRASRRITVAPPYRVCAETEAAGIVLKMRHPLPDQVPLTITTTGTIVRGPYQGEPPLELLSACYRLKK